MGKLTYHSMFWLFIGLTVVILVFPKLKISLLINFAQVLNQHGDDAIRDEIYKAILKIDPYNSRVHWLNADQDLQTLIDSGKNTAALNHYLSLTPHPPLSSYTASNLLMTCLKVPSCSSSTNTTMLWLVAQSLEMNISELKFKLLSSEVLNRADFWSSEIGRHLIDILVWKGRKITPIEPVDRLEPDIEKIASMLGIKTEDITIGEEMIENGQVEKLCGNPPSACNWYPSYMDTGFPWNRAIFVLGTDDDTYDGKGMSLRIESLLIEHLENREAARDGYSLGETIVKGESAYMITFKYKTGDNKNNPQLSLFLSPNSNVLYAGENVLPPSSGEWRSVTIIAWNREKTDQVIYPIFQTFSPGSAWIDDVSFRKILFESSVPPQNFIMATETLSDQK